MCSLTVKTGSIVIPNLSNAEGCVTAGDGALRGPLSRNVHYVACAVLRRALAQKHSSSFSVNEVEEH